MLWLMNRYLLAQPRSPRPRDTGRGGNTQLPLQRSGVPEARRRSSSFIVIHLFNGPGLSRYIPCGQTNNARSVTRYSVHEHCRPPRLTPFKPRGFPSRPNGRKGAQPHHLPSSNPLDQPNQRDRTLCRTPRSARTTSSNGLREKDEGCRGSESGRCAKKCGRAVCKCV